MIAFQPDEGRADKGCRWCPTRNVFLLGGLPGPDYEFDPSL